MASGSIDLFARSSREIRGARSEDLGTAPNLFDVEILTFDRREVASSGAVALEGLAPSLAGTLRPAAGAVALEGLAPEVRISVILAVPAGAVALEGLAPSLAGTLRPAAGAVALEGLAPSLAVVWLPFASFARTIRAPASSRVLGAREVSRTVKISPSELPERHTAGRTRSRRVSATIDRGLSTRIRPRGG